MKKIEKLSVNLGLMLAFSVMLFLAFSCSDDDDGPKEDIKDESILVEILQKLAGEVSRALKKSKKSGQTITLKVKYFDC